MNLNGNIIEDLKREFSGMSDEEIQEQFDLWLDSEEKKGLKIVHISSSYGSMTEEFE